MSQLFLCSDGACSNRPVALCHRASVHSKHLDFVWQEATFASTGRLASGNIVPILLLFEEYMTDSDRIEPLAGTAPVV
ncbi:MAG: hypothetical protein RR317_06955, partial [Bilophila sp.]